MKPTPHPNPKGSNLTPELRKKGGINSAKHALRDANGKFISRSNNDKGGSA